MKGTFFPFPMEGVEEESVSFQSLGDRPHCCLHYTNGNDTLQVDAQKKKAQLITLQHDEANNGYLPS
jgi:hypothetical protein